MTPKRTKKRASFLQSIVDKIEETIYSECLWEDGISENIEYKDGWIEISMNSNGSCEVSNATSTTSMSHRGWRLPSLACCRLVVGSYKG